jgi:hypothetical protein
MDYEQFKKDRVALFVSILNAATPQETIDPQFDEEFMNGDCNLLADVIHHQMNEMGIPSRILRLQHYGVEHCFVEVTLPTMTAENTPKQVWIDARGCFDSAELFWRGALQDTVYFDVAMELHLENGFAHYHIDRMLPLCEMSDAFMELESFFSNLPEFAPEDEDDEDNDCSEVLNEAIFMFQLGALNWWLRYQLAEPNLPSWADCRASLMSELTEEKPLPNMELANESPSC